MRKILKIIPLLLLVGGILYSVIATYIRVIEKGDYLVRYNIPCDPSLGECFSEQQCDDSGGNCETAYYSSIERVKSNLARICGSDISICALANKCMEGEAGCSIKVCDPSKDTCANIKKNNE